MNLLDNLVLEKNNLFQFYIVSGDSQKNKEIVSNFLKMEFNFDFNKNFFSMEGDIFLIDKARELKQENNVLHSGVNGEKKIIFLDFKKINSDTQNSLLKTFEETSADSHIFLFVPDSEFILPTVKSRARVIEGKKEYNLDLAKEFLKGSFLEREKIIGGIEKQDMSVLFDSLEVVILEEKKDIEFYKNFLDLKKYIFDKGVSHKNILTYIALYL